MGLKPPLVLLVARQLAPHCGDSYQLVFTTGKRQLLCPRWPEFEDTPKRAGVGFPEYACCTPCRRLAKRGELHPPGKETGAGQACVLSLPCLFLFGCDFAQAQRKWDSRSDFPCPARPCSASPNLLLFPPWDRILVPSPSGGGSVGFPASPYPRWGLLRTVCAVATLSAPAAVATSCLFNPVLRAELMRHSYLNNPVRLEPQIFAPQQLCVVTEINILTGLAIPWLPPVSGWRSGYCFTVS